TASTALGGWRGAGHASALGAGGLACAAAGEATELPRHRPTAWPPHRSASSAASPRPSSQPLAYKYPGRGTVPGVGHLVFSIGYRLTEMVDSPAQSDSEFVDQYFEDWFSDVDPALLDVNSSVLAPDYRQVLDLIDSGTGGTSAPSSDAQAVASNTPNSEFQVVPPLPGIDTSDSLSIYAPSPLTVSNPWSPPVVEQTAWEPWPAEWALVVPIVPLPAPTLTITLRTTEGDLVVAEGYIQLL
ncbi:hypothetical protein Taro_003046, partial [Colocasia esculenta]|nr:hypothetical protein [Colocasia esculenta]